MPNAELEAVSLASWDEMGGGSGGGSVWDRLPDNSAPTRGSRRDTERKSTFFGQVLPVPQSPFYGIPQLS
jgi:hypothetical protein